MAGLVWESKDIQSDLFIFEIPWICHFFTATRKHESTHGTHHVLVDSTSVCPIGVPLGCEGIEQQTMRLGYGLVLGMAQPPLNSIGHAVEKSLVGIVQRLENINWKMHTLVRQLNRSHTEALPAIERSLRALALRCDCLLDVSRRKNHCFLVFVMRWQK